MSASLMLLFELEYINKLQCCGWNSAAVMTSVSSSILTGLMSTMSDVQGKWPRAVVTADQRRTEALVADA